MLGKQWLNRYEKVEMRGSVIDRSRHRQRKMNGMVTWRFDFIMECLPLMLQASLLLLGYALSNYLYSISKVVASVAIGFTAFGVLFYIIIASAATLSYTCPFQTPPSLILRSLIRFDNEHKKYLERSRKWFGRIFSRKKKRQRPNPGGLYGSNMFSTFGGGNSADHIVLPMANLTNQPPPLFDKETDWDGYMLDSKCIAWMFEKSMDADVKVAIMRLIPEIVWHPGIQTTPLERLYDTVLECFDFSTGHPLVSPKLKEKAYLSAKALLHLTIQRKCIGGESDEAVFRSISRRYKTMGTEYYRGDSDLESTIGIIDRIFGVSEPIPWQNFLFTPPHHAWMAHILLYRAWDVLKKGDSLSDDIRGFILHSFRLETPLPAPIEADCLFTIGLVLDIKHHTVGPSVVDKRCVEFRFVCSLRHGAKSPCYSDEITPQIDSIYTKLSDTFRNPNTNKIDRALEAMELIAPLPKKEIARKSYSLFHVIMQVPVSFAYPQEKKWEASRLAMHGAYKWEGFSPPVKDPQDVLAFLDYHFELASGGDQNQDEPIHYALRALAYASDSVTIDALERFDSTKPSFVYGVCRVFQDDKPLQLRKAALLFLPLIGHRWFNAPIPIMEDDQLKRLCVDWASVVDDVDHSRDVQIRKSILAVLFGMINSPRWRPHIVTEKWKLLEYYASVPSDSRPLRRCIDNPQLMGAIKNVANPAALGLWLEILWSRYGELVPQVRNQLETVTREISQGRRRLDLDRCLKALDAELEKAENALTQYGTWSTDPTALALRTKMDNLRQTRDSLLALMRS